MSNVTDLPDIDLPDYVGEPIHFHVRIIFIIVGVVYVLVGVLGNTVIINAVISNKSMHSPHYYFIVNLAVADLIITGYVITCSVVGLILDHYPVAGFANCVFNGMVVVVGYMASLITLMVISINRYLNICHKDCYNKLFARKKLSSILYCAAIWLFAFIIILPPLFGWGRFHFDRKTHYCGYDRTYSFSYTLFLMLVSIGTPCGIVFACGVAIWRFIRQASHRIYDSSAHAQISRRSRGEVSTTLASTSGTSISHMTSTLGFLSVADAVNRRDLKAQSVQTDAAYKSTSNGVESLQPSELKQQRHLRPAGDECLTVAQTEQPTITVTAPPGARGSIQQVLEKGVSEKSQRYPQYMNRLVTPDELSLIKSLFVVFICFALLLSPYMMTTLLDKDNQWSALAHMTCSYIAYTNSVINWIVYGLMNKKFRNSYKKMFCSR